MVDTRNQIILSVDFSTPTSLVSLSVHRYFCWLLAIWSTCGFIHGRRTLDSEYLIFVTYCTMAVYRVDDNFRFRYVLIYIISIHRTNQLGGVRLNLYVLFTNNGPSHTLHPSARHREHLPRTAGLNRVDFLNRLPFGQFLVPPIPPSVPTQRHSTSARSLTLQAQGSSSQCQCPGSPKRQP